MLSEALTLHKCHRNVGWKMRWIILWPLECLAKQKNGRGEVVCHKIIDYICPEMTYNTGFLNRRPICFRGPQHKRIDFVESFTLTQRELEWIRCTSRGRESSCSRLCWRCREGRSRRRRIRRETSNGEQQRELALRWNQPGSFYVYKLF